MRNSKLRIAVLGYIVRGPLGGMAWHHLQYVLGLKKLGHDVCFVEDSDDYPACYNPEIFECGIDASYGLRFINECFDRLGLKENWAYYDAHKNQWFGKPKETILDFFASVDVLLNVSGVNPLRDWALRVPKRVFIDTDPAFIQIRHLTDENARKLAEKHNAFFTFGENFGAGDCLIPVDGFEWKPTRQPIVLDEWKVTKGNKNNRWTTVMQWDSYRTLEYNGQTFGMKSASFDEYTNLPQMTTERFELVLGSETAPGDFLQSKGWKITNPLIPTHTPWTYQKFIQNSKAEWTIAKHGYASSRSGWFSERSACYLASGRPVLTQETGFSKFIESGGGLLSFSSKEEVLEGIEKINKNYDAHCKTAREIAISYFDYEKVLSKLFSIMYTKI
ncbi:MAG: SOS response-associated peptidase [Acidobacteria bacterium]|nr:SOS response-associated peptidase [Acidobacteriota bacterium]MCA1640305.1 SOS response-associated peptidase [Acidobacteriota bacterium]